MKNLNLHNTKIWYSKEGTAYLAFPANDAGKVFTTSVDGKLLHTLNTPTAEDNFAIPAVTDYLPGEAILYQRDCRVSGWALLHRNGVFSPRLYPDGTDYESESVYGHLE